MSPKITRTLYGVYAVFVCCYISSCSPTLPVYIIKPLNIPTLISNSQQKIPFRVGFFMDDKFEELHYSGRHVDLWMFEWQGKEPFIDVQVRSLFEQAVRQMFKEVVPVTTTETIQDWQEKNLEVIIYVGDIVCKLDSQGIRGERWPPARPMLFTTICAKWTVRDLYGKPITSMIIEGRGQTSPARGYKAQRDVLIKTLDDHFIKVYDNIVMTAWWRDSSWKSY